MEMLQSDPGYGSEASTTSKRIPRTPPYTPHRVKRRLERSDSPASISSVHPTETTSPAKKAAKRTAPDNVKVEELVEGDAGYIGDIDIVYPEELEEKLSSDSRAESSDGSGKDSDTGISQRFQQLGCEDGEEAEFARKRREHHLRKRTSSRLFKRTHSQSIKSDSEVSDIEALGDHDLSSSARRLRRRVRGPSGIEVFDDVPRSSPEPKNAGLERRSKLAGRTHRDVTPDSSSEPDKDGTEPMDLE